ncbi:hypothetical protein [Microbacterium sp. GXF7504]
MARSPIEVGIAAETRAFRQGVEAGIIEPLEDAEKALKDLGKAKGPDQLEKSMKDAQRQTEKLADETKQTARTIEREFDDAYRDAKRSAADGLGGAREAAVELRQEIGQNLGETVSSFRGDMADLGQIGQDTLGGLAATAASVGGAGGMIGALGLAGAAAAWGAFTAGQEDARAKQEELNEAAANFASGYLDGINGAISAAQIFAEIQSIATDPERYQQAKDAAKEWGVSTEVAMGAMAGDATALATAQQGLRDRTAEAEAALAAQEEQVDKNAGAAYDLADSVKSGAERMEALTGALAQGKQQADDAAAALYNYATSAGEATDETDELGNKIVRLPGGKEVVIDAETKRAYEDLDAVEKRLAETNGKKATLKLQVDTSAWDNWTPAQKRGVVAADKKGLDWR